MIAIVIDLKVAQHRSVRMRIALPMKNAMKIERRTPVDRVSVLIPKKKQANSALEVYGMSKSRPLA